MKKSIGSISVLFVLLTILVMSGCAPAPTPEPTFTPSPVPPTFTPSPIPPTSTPVPTATATIIPSPTASENSILNFEVISSNKDEIVVSIDYTYIGDHGDIANVFVVPYLSNGKELPIAFRIFQVEVGHHNVTPVINMTKTPPGDYTIAGFTVNWYGAGADNTVFFSQKIEYELIWPIK